MMIIARYLAFLTVTFTVFTGVSAQNTQSFKQGLSVANGANGASIQVSEAGEAASIVRMLESSRTGTTINGYRVTIFIDNKQDARAGANAAVKKFKELFPDIKTYESYRSPDFKVTVGDCLTKEEAIILWGRINRTFPKAFVSQDQINIADLAE